MSMSKFVKIDVLQAYSDLILVEIIYGNCGEECNQMFLFFKFLMALSASCAPTF